MKKFQILCMAVLCIALFNSCKDDSGMYAEYLHTNGEKTTAIKTCLNASLDTAVAHLCHSGGFYEYKDGLYKLDFSNNQAMMDTLAAHSYTYLSDSLIRCANRLAESCDAVSKTAFGDAIKNMVITDFDALIKGEGTPITDYFEQTQYYTVRDALKSQVSIRMNLFKVNDVWDEMVGNYYSITHQPVTYDVQGYILNSMMNGLLEEMRCEEFLIRTDSTHRDSILRVFF